MQRLALLTALVAIGLVCFTGAAQAAPSAWPGAQPGASPRQAGDGEPGDADGDGVADTEDACPDQAGSETAKGCPDADGDGVPDSADSCPAARGSSTDGCPSVRIWLNGYLEQGADIYIDCLGGCKPSGTAILSLTKASARRVGLSSTMIGRFGFTHNCGEGVFCAREDLKPATDKRLKAYIKAWRNNHGSPVFLPGTLTAEMTSPRKETMSTKVKLGLGSNGGRFTLYGAGYPRPGAGGGSDGDG